MSRGLAVVLTLTLLALITATLYVPLMGTPWERAHSSIADNFRGLFEYGWVWDHWHVPNPAEVPPPPHDHPDPHALADRAVGWHVVAVEYLLILFVGLGAALLELPQARRKRAETHS